MNWFKPVSAILLTAFLVAFLLLGCAQAPPTQGAQPSSQTNVFTDSQGANGTGSGSAAAGTGDGTGQANATAGLQFNEWKAPDGSITLQVPVGWTATERQADSCTVSWAVTKPNGNSEAFMTNQMLVFKSEDARQTYKQYGLTGVDAAPVSGFLGAEQAVSQIIIPLSGSSDFQILERDSATAQQFSQAVCITGLAACDAQVFGAAYSYNGTPMRGEYFVQSFDLGDGTTWWINFWGYSAPAGEWNDTKAALEKIFSSVQYTDSWASKCGKTEGEPSDIIKEVVKSRQKASEAAAEEWDKYIRGG